MRQTLLFESRSGLYALPWPYHAAAKPQRWGTLNHPEYAERDWWAASPDGRHIAYLSHGRSDILYAHGGGFDALLVAPTAVRIAQLPDFRNDHILFTLPGDFMDDKKPFHVTAHSLRSPQGVLVRFLSSDSDDDLEDIDIRNWVAQSLAWDTQRSTLLVSLRRFMPGDMPISVTCALDLRRGCVAHTNRHGKWIPLLPTREISVRGGTIVGVGDDRTTDESTVCNACSRYRPIYVVRDVGQRAHCLLPATFDSKHKPDYAFASCPTLGPDGRTIAFDSDGLWMVDRHSHHYHRQNHDDRIVQICWESPLSLLVLRETGKPDEPGSTALFRVRLHNHGRSAAAPVFLLPNIERIQLLDTAD